MNSQTSSNDTAKSSSSSNTAKPADAKNDQALAKEAEGKEKKKMGFFEKWRASTTAAYEKHRAAGGNL